MTGTPRISVVIPVFNGEQFLSEAISSVLAQNEDSLEIIVIDDGSTDRSAAVAEGFGPPVRVLRQTNSGHVAARNRGIRTARADYITFLDADDLWVLDKLALQVSRLDRNPNVDIVIGQLSYLRRGAEGADSEADSEQFDDHLSLSFSASMFRRRAFDRIGLLDESLPFCDDWDWFMRARETDVPLLIHRHVVLQQRLHEGNMTRQREVGNRFVIEVMRRSLARRRAGTAATNSLPPLRNFLEPEDELE